MGKQPRDGALRGYPEMLCNHNTLCTDYSSGLIAALSRARENKMRRDYPHTRVVSGGSALITENTPRKVWRHRVVCKFERQRSHTLRKIISHP
jgi:hypothetical protein